SVAEMHANDALQRAYFGLKSGERANAAAGAVCRAKLKSLHDRREASSTPRERPRRMHPQSSTALSRITVLDLTQVRSGPTCVRQLADWGANVIKIEPPAELTVGEGPGGPRDGPDFQNLHRNKRSMTLNLKTPGGVDVFRRLVEKADVVVENFRPDVKTRLKV